MPDGVAVLFVRRDSVYKTLGVDVWDEDRPHVTKAEREHTPRDLALWLVELARRCRVQECAA